MVLHHAESQPRSDGSRHPLSGPHQLLAALNERQVGNIGGLGIVNTIVRLTMTHNKNLKYDIYNDNGMEIKIVVGE